MMKLPINLTELSNSPVNHQEERDVPSKNHSLIQARLGGLFNLDDRFNAATELTLSLMSLTRLRTATFSKYLNCRY